MPKTESTRYVYPWARSLFLVVLYIAVLIILWFFPVELVRLFFRTLINGFLYILAGLALIIITFLLIVAIIPAPPKAAPEDEEENEQEWGEDESCVMVGHSLVVPALLNQGQAEQVRETVELAAKKSPAVGAVILDEAHGVITVTAAEEQTATRLLRDIQEALHAEHLTVRKPS